MAFSFYICQIISSMLSPSTSAGLSLTTIHIFQGTVAYYLLLDNRFRVSSGYLGAEFQESMVGFFKRSTSFYFNISLVVCLYFLIKSFSSANDSEIRHFSDICVYCMPMQTGLYKCL